MFYWQGHKYYKESLIESLKNRLLTKLEKWERSILEFALEWLNEQNDEFQVKTSGSTGSPKLISLKREQMIESARSTASYLGLNRGNSALLALPADFIAGKMMIVRALELGLDLHYFSPQVSVIESIDQTFDFAAFIPLQIQYAFDSGQAEKLNQFKTSIIGGAALNQYYVKKLKKMNGDFFATYGMTETITHVAMRDLKSNMDLYSALPGIQFSIDGNHCLEIKSDRLPQPIIYTNDLVELISEKSFVLKGRMDHIINSGGLKIIPEELEETISIIIKKEVFVGFQNDFILGQKVILVAEGEKGDVPLIFTMLKGKIPKNQMPKNILFISDFFRTKNQKINRRKMQDWLLNQSDD